MTSSFAGPRSNQIEPLTNWQIPSSNVRKFSKVTIKAVKYSISNSHIRHSYLFASKFLIPVRNSNSSETDDADERNSSSSPRNFSAFPKDRIDWNEPAIPKPSSCEVSSVSEDSSLSQTAQIPSRGSDFDGNEKASYDPITNYLSPRPKYLRYNPNRRLEILHRREKDGVVEENSGSDQDKDTQSVSIASSIKEEDTDMEKEENLEEGEGEFEDVCEEEEGRSWAVEMFKFLLITMALIFSTLYITSMNIPRSSFEVSEAFELGFFPILNYTYELPMELGMKPIGESASKLWDEVAEAALKQNLDGGSYWEERENDGFTEENETLKGEYEDHTEEQVREAAEEPQSEECSAEEMAAAEENETELLELAVEEDGDQEKGVEYEIFDKLLEKDESIETSKPSIFDGTDEENSVSDFITSSRNEYKLPEAGDMEIDESNTEEAVNFAFEASKITKLISRFGEITYLKGLENLKSELIELMHTESLLKVVVGLSASAIILTFLVLSFQTKKEKGDRKQPAVSVSLKPLLESPVAEAVNIIRRESSLIKPCDRSRSEHIDNVDSSKMLSSSIHSKDEVENFKKFHYREVPTVQFLGEFVVGEVSSSLRNKIGLKNMMIEAEDSSLSVPVQEKPVSKTKHSGPGISEKDLSEFSAVSSSSYGYFTIEKKLVEKEVGRDGEGKQITTPVRRSTRIRNRITSP